MVSQASPRLSPIFDSWITQKNENVSYDDLIADLANSIQHEKLARFVEQLKEIPDQDRTAFIQNGSFLRALTPFLTRDNHAVLENLVQSILDEKDLQPFVTDEIQNTIAGLSETSRSADSSEPGLSDHSSSEPEPAAPPPSEATSPYRLVTAPPSEATSPYHLLTARLTGPRRDLAFTLAESPRAVSLELPSSLGTVPGSTLSSQRGSPAPATP